MPTLHLRKNKKEGFTLIEMVVSLAIFSVVAVIALGALIRIISANQKAQAIQAAVTNVNFALESMSREIRVGKDLIPTSGTAIDEVSFVSMRSHEKCELYNAYRFIDVSGIKHLQKAEEIDPDDCAVGSKVFTDSDFIDITSPNITLTGGSFTVTPDPADSSKPYKLISFQLSGFAGDKEKNRTYFDVQTAVSSRVQ